MSKKAFRKTYCLCGVLKGLGYVAGVLKQQKSKLDSAACLSAWQLALALTNGLKASDGFEIVLIELEITGQTKQGLDSLRTGCY